MRSWRRSRPGGFHHGADLDPAADPEHRAVFGQRQRGVHVLGGHHRVADHPGAAAADLAERGVIGHRVADGHQGRAQPAEPGLPLGRRPGTGRVAGGHTVGANVLGQVLWSCPVSGARPGLGPPLTGQTPAGPRKWARRHRPIRGAGGGGTFRRAGRARRKEEKRGCMETSDLIARASAGDDNAFRELVEVHSRELQVHCYRILGSLQDAEDALQETLVSAWRNLGDFRQRSSLRTWLYQIATNRCLSMLRAGSRRPRIAPPLPEATLPEPTGAGDAPPWLEPYPDVLLDHLVDQRPGPEDRYETTEAISLAFITALQLLPPRQRAAPALRDVLGYPAAEVAQMLDATSESVQSALKRARATVDSHLAGTGSRGSSRPARQ